MRCQIGKFPIRIILFHQWTQISDNLNFLWLSSSISPSKSPGGKQITITVRETTTERMKPVNQSYPGNSLPLFRAFLSHFWSVCDILRHSVHWKMKIYSFMVNISFHHSNCSCDWRNGTANRANTPARTTSIVGNERIRRSNGIAIRFQGMDGFYFRYCLIEAIKAAN